jgi:FkbM family methyltransferase
MVEIFIENSTGRYYMPAGDCVTNQVQAGGVFDPEVVDVVMRYLNKESVVLDVGAFFGQMSILFAQLSKKVYSFESNPFLFRLLERNIQENQVENVVPFPGAIWEECGREFSIDIGGDGLSAKGLASPGGYLVRTVSIDSLKILDPISVMKFDIQGADLMGMRGARETILRNRMPIIFEYEAGLSAQLGATWEDHEKFIQSIGYEIKENVQSSGVNFLIGPK